MHVLYGLGGQHRLVAGGQLLRLVDPRVKGRVDGQLPLQLPVLGRGRLMEQRPKLLRGCPGRGGRRLAIVGEAAHLEAGPASGLLRADGHARHPEVAMESARVVHRF